jgi:uncharacterized protein (DUF2141 family)
MNPILKILIIAAILAIPGAAHAGDLVVDLSGVRAGGTLYIQLQTREQFMTGARAYGEIVRTPAAGPVSLTMKDVAPGDYALTVWHDDNGNNRFDVDPASGRPADGWAAPNADTLRAQPRFDQVKASVAAGGAKIALPLRYGR